MTTAPIFKLRCQTCHGWIASIRGTLCEGQITELLCNRCWYDHYVVAELVGVADLYKIDTEDTGPSEETAKIRADNFREGTRELRLVKKELDSQFLTDEDMIL